MDNNLAIFLLIKAKAIALKPSYVPKCKGVAVIRNVILGSHLTFRYILATSVLGKATDPLIHPRSLQAGSTLKGAYDARSLCHGVLVPFEREHLGDALGGSNEPYLNKPARFTEVHMDNAVRAGQDRASLRSLYDFLEELARQPKDSVFEALCACIYFAIQRLKVRESLLPEPRNISSRHEILSFIRNFTSKSVKGETCVITTGAVLSCIVPMFRGEFRVIVHPVNQAGSSSNEVADVDVYLGNRLFYAIEVKDKSFTVNDVTHAAKKVARAQHDSLVFVTGPQGVIRGMKMEDIETRLSTDQVNISFVTIDSFTRTVLALTPRTTAQDFYAHLVSHCKSARAKDATVEHLNKCAKQMNWII